MEEAVIVSAVRTPIGKFQGGLSSLKVTEIGSKVVAEAVRRAHVDPKSVDEVIMGCVLTAGVGQAPARQAALGAGLPPEVSALTINKVCGSSLKAAMLAASAVRCGDAEIVVAGGMESMSRAPYLLPDARTGARLGHVKAIDSMVHDGLWDAYHDKHMGTMGELVARKYEVSREDQDEFALGSHRKAATAWKEGKFEAEVLPVEVPQRKGDPLVVSRDEGFREDASLEGLGKLRPAFDRDGTVTAGNASQINDGAAAVVVMSAARAKKEGVRPMARIAGYATGGVPPEWVLMAPEKAVPLALGRAGKKLADMDLVEINEAFSSQLCALRRQLDIDPSKLNVHGGAVALGHPIGASGARLLTTLLHALEQRDERWGVVSLCLGGGNAVAMVIERG